MQKLLLLTAAVCFSLAALPAGAQDATTSMTIAGLPWGVSPDSVKKTLVARGFSAKSADEDGDIEFAGPFLDEDAGLVAFFTKDRKLARVGVILLTADPDARRKYFEVKETLTQKYGKPSFNRERFVSPYYAGDGYEDQAIRLGKAAFLTEWTRPNAEGAEVIRLGISRSLTVILDYESAGWAAEDERRRAKAADDL